MFGSRITIFKLFGFAVRIDASWLIIAALITWTLAAGLFPAEYPGLPPGTYWAMGVLGAIGLFVSIVVHELSHSLVARRYGLEMKGITLFVFGGVAEMPEEPPDAKTEFLMAVAGPVASVAIGFVCYALHSVVAGDWPLAAVGVLAYLYWINWILAAFNMVPAFPLDGGRVLRSILWWRWKGDLPRATRIAAAIGSGFGVALMALGVLELLFAGNFIGATWWFVIGMFLKGASQSSYRQLTYREALKGEHVDHFMKTPVTVPPGISIEDLVDEYVYRYHYKMFPVVADSQEVLGCISTEDVKAFPRDEWNRRTVREAAHPCDSKNTIPKDEDALRALASMSNSGSSRLMVLDGNRLVGVLALKDLMEFLSMKLDLEGIGAARAANGTGGP